MARTGSTPLSVCGAGEPVHHPLKKLKDPDEPLSRFFQNVQHLGPHLGPVLYELPPRWPVNLERFEISLDALGGVGASARLTGTGRPFRPRHVVEFLEPSWYDERVFDMMRRRRVALCLHDMQGSASGKLAVDPFVSVRFQGWTKVGGHAPRDAVRLRDRLHARLNH